MKTTITASEALKIAQKYQASYKIPGVISDDTNKSVKFYESFYNVKGFAWLVLSDLEDNYYEGSDEFTIVISDEKLDVEFVLDNNGISRYTHIDVEYEMTDEEFVEIFGDDEKEN
ncbi:hypothetical protein WAZ07_18310 [Bacillus sp. FJAT-51639]|uniref:Uncharacterized protein n=1 Tax=Bacillus bruguierae TaxID=3127667 RepID=A0ABU8FMT9_9BACI